MGAFYILRNTASFVVLGRSGCLLLTTPSYPELQLTNSKLQSFKSLEAGAVSVWMEKCCVHTQPALCGWDIKE